MLEIQNLNVKYTKQVLKNINLKFYNNHIYGIVGESGTGKTTLLKAILGEFQDADLIYNGEKIDLNKREEFLKNNVFYVDQFGNFFQNMNMKQHFEFYASMKNEKISLEKIQELLKKVHLDNINLKKSPSKLSLGERKRFLIALSLYSEKEILILDEPTASLDQDNILLMKSILCEIHNKIVIISTHDQQLCESCDTLYRIKDCQVTLEKGSDIYEDKQIISKTYQFHPRQYFKYKNGFQWLHQFLLIALGLFVCIQSTIGIKIVAEFNNHAKNASNVLGDNMIYFRNKYSDDEHSDWIYTADNYENSIPFSNEDMNEILKIDGVKSIVPYIFLYNYDFTGEQIYNQTRVIRNEKVDHQFNDLFICVAPYMPDEEVGQKYQGTLISKELADGGRIQEGDELELSLYVPTNQKINNSEYGYRSIYCEIIDLNVAVGQIVDNNEARRFASSGNVVYMPYEKFFEFFEKCNQTFEVNDYLITCEEGKLEDVYKTITEKNVNYDLYSYALSLAHSIQQAKDVVSKEFIVMAVLSAISLMIFFFVKYSQIFVRKKEKSLLMYYGITKKEINSSLNFEILIHSCLWLICSIVFGIYVQQYDMIFISLVVICCLILIEKVNLYLF